jgi:hypothetical protein
VRELEASHVAGQGDDRDATMVERYIARLLDDARQPADVGDGRGEEKTGTSWNKTSLSTSWKWFDPISARGTWPQMASTGAPDFFAS